MGDAIGAVSEAWWRIAGWPTDGEWSAWWGFVGAVAAAGALFVAAYQLRQVAASNRELTSANKRAAAESLAESRPYVTVEFELRKAEFRVNRGSVEGAVNISVRNNGRSPARDLRITFEPPLEAKHLTWQPGGEERHHSELRKWFGGISTYPTISAGRTISRLFDKMPEALADTKNHRQYTATAEYSTLDGAHHFSEVHLLDLDLLATTIPETDPLRRMSKDIEGVSEAIKANTTAVNRIRSALRDPDQPPTAVGSVSGSGQAPRRRGGVAGASLPSRRRHRR